MKFCIHTAARKQLGQDDWTLGNTLKMTPNRRHEQPVRKQN